MDLLGGYGSDASSSSDHSSEASVTGPTVPPPPSAATTTTKPTTATLPPTKTLLTNNKSSTNSTPPPMKKKLKLLKLNNFLPPDILHQLTKSTVQGRGEDGVLLDSDSDSDQENSDDDAVVRPAPTTKKHRSNWLQHDSQTTTSLEDEGLSSFLNDLNSHVPCSKPPPASNKIYKVENESALKNKEVMGSALMQVSSSVTRIKRSSKSPSSTTVVDIHGTNGSKSTDVVVEDVDSDVEHDEMNDAADKNITATTLQQESPIPMFPSQTVTKSTTASTKNPVAAATSSVPRPSSSIYARERGGIRRVSTVTHTTSSSLEATHPNSTEAQSHQPLYTSAPSYPPPIQPTQTQTQHQPLSKKSKRERDKALRSGNLAALESISQTLDLVQPSSSNYSTGNAPIVGEDAQASQFKMGGLATYVPSMGGTVQGGKISGKMKSKSQIHSLVANARSLEAERARMDLMGIGKGSGKSTRADAKRKYGW